MEVCSSMSTQADLETPKQGKPYIRSILAVLFKLRFGSMWDKDDCYKQADLFVKQLEDDVRYSK
jgi:hypothetical protein